MKRCVAILFVLALIAPRNAYAQSTGQTPPQESSTTEKNPESEQQVAGTATKPFNTPDANEKSAESGENKPKPKKETWSLSDKIAVIASIAAFLQFVALVFTVRVMILNGQTQLRAYVFIDEAIRTSIHTDKLGTSFQIKNTGQTPAYDISLYVGAKFSEDKLAKPYPALKMEGFYTIGPGQFAKHLMTADPALSDEELSKIRLGVGKYFVIGYAEYRDAFGKRHCTEFRVEYTSDSVSDGWLRISEEGNRSFQLRKYGKDQKSQYNKKI